MTILHSSRANIFFLEHCRVLVKDGVPVYLSDEGKYLNIPAANTTVVLLGTGTSITNSAVRLLSSFGVILGFCRSDCTPIISGSEVEWFTPQSEYRPTEWCQKWISIWSDENKRLAVAKRFQEERIDIIEEQWNKDPKFSDIEIEKTLRKFRNDFAGSTSIEQLLGIEGDMTKKLYAKASGLFNMGEFDRDREGTDLTNSNLNHGNYLAYGVAACALWVLGIPHSLAVMHGKTRRGALVFDVADIVKDAMVLPLAFSDAAEGIGGKEFGKDCTSRFVDENAMGKMFRIIETVATEYA